MTGQPRTVIVTGGSRGLGAGIVQSFLDSGDRVATCSRSETDAVREWRAQYADRFLFVEADLADREQSTLFAKATLDQWGSVDVLVNNAGVARDGILALFSDEDSDTVIDLNLKATIHLTRQIVRNMLARDGGRIVNISSITGQTGYRGLTVYGATKAALDGFTRGLAREVGSRNITVNSIASGYLRTEMSHGLDDGQLNQIVRRTPAGRLGEPDDIARAVQFLVDERNDWITGQVLVVDGGLTC
ncbi:3-oxoacyl-ACP reductase family protein [Nocardioides bizhenqiangii]|uniref:3-oxoacyl-ACP reductase family protein n=1 Tax=Nocardioides bizhenqiangii TaxID=3095076 RepID=A0ABZ0ZNT9_9ACTN|nr:MULTISPECIES: 3-oxoacyl-ACP reductase family protein [unclassified Nocardioides]MDZ5620005.1 3-oxoacyl-ACP reductase family protein [Nocardioides sp. HM23]WQQ25993.1 3-oxoacyl-ACP reductase family protein [Nocardioides sp. HM61]